MVVFEERGTRRNLSVQRREPTNSTTYDAGSGNRTRTTLVGGECSHHCAIPAPQGLRRRDFTLRKIMNWIRFYCRFQRPVCNKGLHGQEGKAIKSLLYTGPQTTEESSEHLSVYQESYFLLTTRMFSWIPSKFFNSRKQTLNSVAVTSSAQMLAASWTFFGGLVWITVRKTSEGGVLN